MNIVKKIEKYIPNCILREYRLGKWILKKEIYSRRYDKTIARLRKKNSPINVVFFVIEATNWKYDYLYRKLDADPNFNVSVLVCQEIDRGHEVMLEILNRCYKMCQRHGYNVIKSYDEATDTVFDPQSLNPDIIFYCNPYPGFFNKGYFMNSFPNSLICYANYSYEIIPFTWAFTGNMQNLAWRYFCESDGHEKLVRTYSPFRGWNVYNSGYPAMDAFLFNQSEGKDWKIKDPKVKRIIWAPHQSIFDAKMSNDAAIVQFSTFLLFADFMLELAEKYKDKIQIAFKPHPKLILNLYAHSGWGREKTDAYYKRWQTGENTCYVSGDYVDLFCSSDAMIHDSGSFTAEYLCTNNPCMYLSVYMDESNMNEMGKQAFRSHYQGKTIEDIDKFIKDVVIGGKDTMKEQRTNFYESSLLPPNNMPSVADNIINEIKKNINRL